MYEYGPRLRGGPISGDTIRHGHQLGGKRAAPPETRPRTDVDGNDCCQNPATNEHEIMNKLGHASGPSTNGLFVRYDIIHRCGVGESPNTHTGDSVALCLRGSGRGSEPARANRTNRSRNGRQRRGGGHAALSEERPAPRDGVAHNTATGDNRPALEDDARAAGPLHHTTASWPSPLITFGPNPNLHALPPRVPNPNFYPELYGRPDDSLIAAPYRVPPRVPNPNFFPEPPARPNSNLPAPLAWRDCPVFSDSSPSTQAAWSSPGALQEPVQLELNTPAARIYPNPFDRPFSEWSLLMDNILVPSSVGGFWNHHFPWNLLHGAPMPEYDLMFWREWQNDAPTGVPPGFLIELNRDLERGVNPLRLSEVSVSALRR